MVVKCPDLTPVTPIADISKNVPNSTPVPTEILAGSAYLTNPTLHSECAVIYSLVLASDETMPVGGEWLTIDPALGTVSVSMEELGDETVKIKYTQAGQAG